MVSALDNLASLKNKNLIRVPRAAEPPDCFPTIIVYTESGRI